MKRVVLVREPRDDRRYDLTASSEREELAEAGCILWSA